MRYYHCVESVEINTKAPTLRICTIAAEDFRDQFLRQCEIHLIEWETETLLCSLTVKKAEGKMLCSKRGTDGDSDDHKTVNITPKREKTANLDGRGPSS